MIYLDEEKCLKKWKPSRSYNSQEYIIRKIIKNEEFTNLYYKTYIDSLKKEKDYSLGLNVLIRFTLPLLEYPIIILSSPMIAT